MRLGGNSGNCVINSGFNGTSDTKLLDGRVEAVGNPDQTGPLTFEIPYVVRVGNVGRAKVYKVQVNNDLSRTFQRLGVNPTIGIKGGTLRLGGNSGNCVINSGFNGTSDTKLLDGRVDLASGKSCEIRFTVEFFRILKLQKFLLVLSLRYRNSILKLNLDMMKF